MSARRARQRKAMDLAALQQLVRACSRFFWDLGVTWVLGVTWGRVRQRKAMKLAALQQLVHACCRFYGI